MRNALPRLVRITSLFDSMYECFVCLVMRAFERFSSFRSKIIIFLVNNLRCASSIVSHQQENLNHFSVWFFHLRTFAHKQQPYQTEKFRLFFWCCCCTFHLALAFSRNFTLWKDARKLSNANGKKRRKCIKLQFLCCFFFSLTHTLFLSISLILSTMSSSFLPVSFFFLV